MQRPAPSSSASRNKVSRVLRCVSVAGASIFVCLGGAAAAVGTVPSITAATLETVVPLVSRVDSLNCERARFTDGLALRVNMADIRFAVGDGSVTHSFRADTIRLDSGWLGMIWRGERAPIAWANAVNVEGGQFHGAGTKDRARDMLVSGIQLAAVKGESESSTSAKEAKRGLAFNAELSLSGVPFKVQARIATSTTEDGSRPVRAALENADGSLRFDGTMVGGETLDLDGRLTGSIGALPGPDGQPVELASDVAVEGQTADLRNLQLNVGNALRATGQIEVNATGRPSLKGMLDVTKLRPDALPSAIAATGGTKDEAADGATSRLPTGWIGKADAELTVKLPSLAPASTMPEIGASAAEVRMDDSTLTLAWSAPWGGGDVSLDAEVGRAEDTEGLALGADVAVKGLALAKLADGMTGTARLDAGLNTAGVTVSALREAVDGRLTITAPEIQVPGRAGVLRDVEATTTSLADEMTLTGILNHPRVGTAEVSGRIAPLAPWLRGTGRTLAGSLTAATDGVELESDLRWRPNRGFTAKLRASAKDVATLLPQAPPSLRGRSLDVGANVTGFVGDALEIGDASLSLGRLTLTGTGKIPVATPLDGARFDLDADTINLTPFLSDGSGANDATADKTGNGPQPADQALNRLVEAVQDTDVALGLAVETVKIPGAPHMHDVRLNLAARDGALDLDLAHVKALGGTVTGTAYLNRPEVSAPVHMTLALSGTNLVPDLPRGTWHGPINVVATADTIGASLSAMRGNLAVRWQASGEAVALTPPKAVPAPPEAVAVLPGIQTRSESANTTAFAAGGEWKAGQGLLNARLGPETDPTFALDLGVTPERHDGEPTGAQLVDGRMRLADLAQLRATGRHGSGWSEMTLQSTPIPLSRLNAFGVPAPKAGRGRLFMRLWETKDGDAISVDGSLAVQGVKTRGPKPYDRIESAKLGADATFARGEPVSLSGTVHVNRTHWADIDGKVDGGRVDANLTTVKPIPLDSLLPKPLQMTIGGTADVDVQARSTDDGSLALSWEAAANNGFLRYPGLRQSVGVSGAQGTARLDRNGFALENIFTTEPASVEVRFSERTDSVDGNKRGAEGAKAPSHTLRVSLRKPVPLLDLADLMPITNVPRGLRQLVSVQFRRGTVTAAEARTVCPGTRPLVCLRKLMGSTALSADLAVKDVRLRPAAGISPVALDRLTAEFRRGTLTVRFADAESASAAGGDGNVEDASASAIRTGTITVDKALTTKRVARGKLSADIAVRDLLTWARHYGYPVADRFDAAKSGGRIAVNASGARGPGVSSASADISAEVDDATLVSPRYGRIAIADTTARLVRPTEGAPGGRVDFGMVDGQGWRVSGTVGFDANSPSLSDMAPTSVDLTAALQSGLADRLGLGALMWREDDITVGWSAERTKAGAVAGPLSLDGGDACLKWATAGGDFDIKRCGKEKLKGQVRLALDLKSRIWRVRNGALHLGDQPLIETLVARGRIQPFGARGEVELARIPLSWVRARAPQNWLPAVEGVLAGTVEIAWPLDWDAELTLGRLKAFDVLPNMAAGSGRVEASPTRIKADLAVPRLGQKAGKLDISLTTQRPRGQQPETHGMITLASADARQILGPRQPVPEDDTARATGADTVEPNPPVPIGKRWRRVDREVRQFPVPRLPGIGHVRLQSGDIAVASKNGRRMAELRGAIQWSPANTELSIEIAEQTEGSGDAQSILLSTLMSVNTDPSLMSPELSLEASTSAIALDDIWRTAVGGGQELVGRLRADLSLSGRWRRGLDGLLGELRIEGQDIDVRDARLLPAMFAQVKDAPKGDILNELHMNRLMVRVMLRDGELRVDPLFAETPLGLAFAVVDVQPKMGRIKGRGSIKPLNSLTDWMGAIPFIGSTVQTIAERMEMPLSIGGTLHKVDVSIDDSSRGSKRQ